MAKLERLNLVRIAVTAPVVADAIYVSFYSLDHPWMTEAQLYHALLWPHGFLIAVGFGALSLLAKVEARG